jgi:hypothetical protein
MAWRGFRTAHCDAGVHCLGRPLAPVLAALALLAGPATADDGGLMLFSTAGTQVRADDVVELRWTPLPGDVDELELLLSLDGTWEQPLRLTEQIDPRTLSFAWRVPNLPAGAARIRIRFGGPRGEQLAPPSAPFTIIGAPSRPTAGLAWSRAELWVVEPGAANPSRATRRPPSLHEAADRHEILAAGLAPETPDAGACGWTGQAGSPAEPTLALGGRRGLVARIRQPLTFPMRP